MRGHPRNKCRDKRRSAKNPTTQSRDKEPGIRQASSMNYRPTLVNVERKDAEEDAPASSSKISARRYIGAHSSTQVSCEALSHEQGKMYNVESLGIMKWRVRRDIVLWFPSDECGRRILIRR